MEYQGVNLVYLKCAAGDAGPYQTPVDVYSKKEAGKERDRTMKYWIRPASLTVEAKQSEIAELFEKFVAVPFIDRINKRASMEHIRRGYLEDFLIKLQRGCAGRDSDLFGSDSDYQFSGTGSLY